jgi:hypothetical protein
MIPDLFERSPAAGFAVTSAALLVLFAAYRAVRTVVRTAGQFAEWVFGDQDRTVRACYALAVLFGIGGATTTGVGVSRINSAPDKRLTDQDRRQEFMTTLANKIAATSDKDRLEAYKALAEAYDRGQPKPGQTTAVALVSTAETEPAQPVNYPPGAPLVAGGVVTMLVGLLTFIRIAMKYD